jgi:hypothetical protein
MMHFFDSCSEILIPIEELYGQYLSLIDSTDPSILEHFKIPSLLKEEFKCPEHPNETELIVTKKFDFLCVMELKEI